MPICWSRNDEFAIKNLKDDDTVYVAGWGNTYDQYCNTNKHGPSPYQRCQKQFVYEGESHYGCTRMRSPSSNDQECYRVMMIMEDGIGKGAYEDKLKEFDAIRVKRVKNGVVVMERDCFSFEGARHTHGWCATCNPDVNRPGEAGYCRINNDGNV